MNASHRFGIVPPFNKQKGWVYITTHHQRGTVYDHKRYYTTAMRDYEEATQPNYAPTCTDAAFAMVEKLTSLPPRPVTSRNTKTQPQSRHWPPRVLKRATLQTRCNGRRGMSPRPASPPKPSKKAAHRECSMFLKSRTMQPNNEAS